MPPNTMSLGLPTASELKGYRIWDAYFTPSFSHPGRDGGDLIMADIQRSLPTIALGQFEKLHYFAHVGLGTTTDPAFETLVRQQPQTVLKPLETWPDLLIGSIQLNPHDPVASSDALRRWLRDGPMRGVYFAGGGPAAMTCTDPRFHRLVEQISELGGVIMQHTWLKTGGKQGPGESTPAELAQLAAAHPHQKFICAHAGGQWEEGIRAIADHPNVLIETSGFDATAGFIEMAVRDLGASRIIFGSHLPSRSLGTELSKVIAAEISEEDKRSILSANFRRLLNVA
ncbi:MAG: amidohydrolase family protein [Pirellulaceae bacterium]